MSEHNPQPLTGLYVRLAVVACLILAASLLGYWLGSNSVPFDEAGLPAAAVSQAPAAAAVANNLPQQPAAPLYFFLSVPPGSARNTVAEQISMASSAGIHRYVVSVPLPWDGDMRSFMEPLDFVIGENPAGRLLVNVKLDPPAQWLSENEDEAAPGGVSLASEPWKDGAGAALGALVSAVNAALTSERVEGYIIGCLDGGMWLRGGAIDRSAANEAGFRKWLKSRYVDDEQLQTAWDDSEITLDSAGIPENAAAGPDCAALVHWPELRPRSDFLAYTSDVTASRIIEFTELIKQISGRNTRVIANYGYSLELADPAAGHYALSRLLETDIDGFASPVSYFDRGLGGAGGMMGPVDTALIHGKQWYLIDDTRTGIARDNATGEITRPRNVRPEDIYSVQQRNFAAALSRGIGLFWSDAEGEGRLHDANMWRRFGVMASIYRDSANWAYDHTAELDDFDGDDDGLQTPQMSVLAVVVDEGSRFVQGCSEQLHEILLRQGRDCASRAGLPVKFYLLRDVVSGKAPGAPLYLFLNAFHLGHSDRARLRGVLEENRANAIWMYAPGYFNEDGAAVENIEQLTGISVKAFDGPATTGSTFALSGKWISQDAIFGARMEIEPLFYIDDENADTLARFTDSEKPSIATRFFEGGWGSVLCAEPSLTPHVLREILSILEVFMCQQPGMQNYYDTFFFGEHMLGIHGRESGERTLEFDQPVNIEDLIAPETGWRGRRVINMPLKTGDTRLLKITGRRAG